MPFELANDQWQDGLNRLSQSEPAERPALERATRAIEDELRRRLGGAFTVAELVDLYEQGTSWCTDVAMAAVPEHPQAWDVRIVGDAAFGRYLRSARDYAGGRQLG